MAFRSLALLGAAWLLGAALMPGPVVAQQGSAAFPSQPVRIVVPYPPGGTTDLMARAIAEPMSRTLGQPVIVENKPGAAGALGTQQVARSTPDGHTLLFANNGQGITPHLRKDAGYDFVKDFASVGIVSLAPMVLVIHPSVPANDVATLVQYARANPGRIEYSSAGQGSFGHVATEMFSRSAGVQMLHVPYKGQAPATTAVIAGEVKLLMTTSSAQMSQHVKEGKLKLLGVTSAEPTALVPDAPPIGRTVEKFTVEVWFGLLAPSGTPAPNIAKLNDALNRALAAPEMRERFAGWGVMAAPGQSTDLGNRVQTEAARWSATIKAADIKAE